MTYTAPTVGYQGSLVARTLGNPSNNTFEAVSGKKNHNETAGDSAESLASSTLTNE